MKKPRILDHPLVKHKMALLRNKNTGTKEFKELVSELAMLLCYEATADLPTEPVTIKTPLGPAQCEMLQGRKLAIIPILRAGLGMVDGMLSLIPAARVGHIGLYRDPETLQPVEYYCKLPADIAERKIFVLDPMLATGGSAADAITLIKQRGGKEENIVFIGIMGVDEGIQKLQKEHPGIQIYLACKDEILNDHGYIVPGLGDAGDRIFGTK
jgi:uracil phosphoribosyltransferase